MNVYDDAYWVRLFNEEYALIHRNCGEQQASTPSCQCCCRAGRCCPQVGGKSEGRGDLGLVAQGGPRVQLRRPDFVTWLQSQSAKLLRLYRGQR